MPIYEYCCLKCSHRFEELVLSQKDRVVCPSCGAKEVKKLFSSFGMSGNNGGSCSSCKASSCQNCK